MFILTNFVDVNYLRWCDLEEKPLMLIPRTLIFGISEECMLESCKVLFDFLDGDDVPSIPLSTIQTVKLWEQFCTIVPSRVVAEILIYH